ncbi:MAG: class I SAM-dependent methyltransferase [Bacteroidota bacterium]
MTSIACPVCGSNVTRDVSTYGEFSIHRCDSCDVEFANPMKSPGKEWYENHPLYRNRYQAVGEYVGWMHKEFLVHVSGNGQRLLDVGCGTGDFVAEACRRGFNAVGLDFDAQAIAIGRNHWKTDRLFDLSIEDYFKKQQQPFDAITFYEVLEHLESPGPFLAALKRYLKPGGRISFSIPNRDSSLNSLYRRLVPDIDYPPHHLTRWSKQSVRKALEKNGYMIEILKPLIPSLSDQTFDILRTRFNWLPHKAQRILALSISIILLPIDLFLRRATSLEGRGMMIIAKAL